MTVGILVEKPSAKRNFSAALGGDRGTFEGEDYVLASARGHLIEFVAPDEMVPGTQKARMKSWAMNNLPWDINVMTWKAVPKSGAAGILSEIRSALAGVDEIVIGTDVDPTGEGNAIFWSIMHHLGLDTSGKKFSRMFFTDEAPKSIQKAFRDRKPVGVMTDDPAYAMALTRSKFDLLSMQFTRIATVAAAQRKVVRQGRLKSAMVKITHEGLEAKKNHRKIPFYENRFKDDHGVVYSDPDADRFKTKDEVPQNLSASTVVKDSETMKQTKPPRLLDLAGLSSILSGRGITADTVLKVYQRMYEAQIVSYPRTEDKTITNEQFNELLPLVDRIAEVVGVDPSLLTHRSPRSTHVKDTGAHGANRPGSKVPGSLDALKRDYGPAAPLIYDLLAKNYLAMLGEDYRYEQQKGHIKDYPKYVGVANVPKDLGFKKIFTTDDDAQDDVIAQGLGTDAEPFIHEGFPKAPPTPTMKWLMKQLENRDVGTGATRTSIYAEVTNAKGKNPPLLVETRGKLSMSQVGEISARLLPDTHIGDLAVTEFLMQKMREVAEGTTTEDAVLSVMADWVRDDITTMKANAATMRKELGLTEIKSEKHTGIWKHDGTEEEVSFNKSFSGHTFTDEECEKLLNGETISFPAKSKAGKAYTAKGFLARQVFNGRSFVGFSLAPFEASVPDTWAGHRFTDDEKAKLKAGEQIEITDAVGKSGKPFEATVAYGLDPKEPAKKTEHLYLVHFGTSSAPSQFMGHTFTDDEKKALDDGETIFVDGLYSARKKKTYSANLALEKQSDGSMKIAFVKD